MSWTIRPLNLETDLPRVAELMCLVESETVTTEILQDRETKWPEKGIQTRVVTVNPQGEIAGYAHARWMDYWKPGLFGIMVIVDRASRQQGIGSQLMETVSAFAQENGATRFRTYLRDNDPEGLRFAEKQGFYPHNHTFESALEVETFDPSPFGELIREVKASGIWFFSFADTNQSEEAQRKLYDLNTITAYDMPDGEDDSPRPFEQFVSDVFGGYWFRPDGQIFAAHGEQWVGMTAIGEIYPGVMYNMHTGVLKEYRGRRIAQALKLLSMEFCRKHNARLIRTNNDSRNAPMLAINRKMGYQPEPGWFLMRKDL